MDPKGPLPPNADSVAVTSREMWRLFVGSIPGAWLFEGQGADAVVTGLPLASQNGVWAALPDADPDVVDGLLDRVAATGLPHLLALRGNATQSVVDVAKRRGMRLAGQEPTMILGDSGGIDPAGTTDLTIRELAPQEGAAHAAVAGPVFGAPPGVFETVMNERVLAVPGVRCYAGAVRGETVVTGVGVTLLGATAVFSVATLPEHRGRGFGTAVTARAIADGVGSGATWAWLQSSESGRRAYERLGFRTVETASFWVSD